MKKLVMLLAVVSLFSMSNVSYGFFGKNRRPVANTVNAVAHVVTNGENRTAQGVANIMARLRQVGHHGGNPGYEGCGCASTQQGAYNICCYANQPWKTVDVGYAQDSSGMWYCCRRYSTK